jgi:hypothetical protein
MTLHPRAAAGASVAPVAQPNLSCSPLLSLAVDICEPIMRLTASNVLYMFFLCRGVRVYLSAVTGFRSNYRAPIIARRVRHVVVIPATALFRLRGGA